MIDLVKLQEKFDSVFDSTPAVDFKEWLGEQYYIQNGWVGNVILWWAIDSCGYTTEIDKAGRFSRQEAELRTQRPQDIAWECKHVDECLKARKIVIDGQYLDSKYKTLWRKGEPRI